MIVARGRDPPDPARGRGLREPERAVGARGDAKGLRVHGEAGAELHDVARGGDPADAARVGRQREPELAVGPATMSAGSSLPDRPLLNSVITPAVVIAPILPVACSVNQSRLSGPLTIELGSAPSLRPSVNSVIEPVGRDPADHVRGGIHVPEVAVGADSDVVRIADRGNRKLGDVARLGHARDPTVAAGLGDPEVAVRPGDDAPRAAGGEARRELGDDGARRDPADRVVVLLREPGVPVGTGGDAPQPDAGRQPGLELGDRSGRSRVATAVPEPRNAATSTNAVGIAETHCCCIDPVVRFFMERLSATWQTAAKSALLRWSSSSTWSSSLR